MRALALGLSGKNFGLSRAFYEMYFYNIVNGEPSSDCPPGRPDHFVIALGNAYAIVSCQHLCHGGKIRTARSMVKTKTI